MTSIASPDSSTAPTPASLDPQIQSQREAIAQNYYQLRLGYEGMMIENLQRQAKIVERLALKTQDGTVGQASEPANLETGEDMGVSVGNTIHYHYEQPAASDGGNVLETVKSGAAAADSSVAAAAKSGMATTLGKAALMAALAATGAGAGVAVPWWLGAFAAKTAPAVTNTIQGDAYDVQKWIPPVTVTSADKDTTTP
jgi:hypothetical protein